MGIGSATGVTVRHQPSSPLSPASGQGSCFALHCPMPVYLLLTQMTASLHAPVFASLVINFGFPAGPQIPLYIHATLSCFHRPKKLLDKTGN